MDRFVFVVNSYRRCLNAFAVIWLMTVCVYRLDGADTREALEFLSDYCVECHMPGNAEAGIDVDSFRTEQDMIGSGKNILRVLDAVENQLMPPEDALQPPHAQRAQFVEWIKGKLLTGACCDGNQTSPVVIRRLNRQEYDNTLRDLMGLELKLSQDFPPDDSGFGFDNVGSALNTSPVHVERYLLAAEKAMQAAIKVPSIGDLPPIELIGLRTYPLAVDGEVTFEHHLKPGRYLVNFSLVRAGISETAPTPRLCIGFGTDSRTVVASKVQDETVVYRFWLNVFESDNQVRVTVAKDDVSQLDAVEQKVGQNVSGDKRYGNDHGLHVDSMVVHGPVAMDGQHLTLLHKTIFTKLPANDSERISFGQEIVQRFASAAFRRPVEEQEVERLMQLLKVAVVQGESFESAVQIALTAILVSPQFLFLVEPESAEQDRPLTGYELASRLSYFLWSSMPDEQLLAAAADGTLRTDLKRHVGRMLADPKSQAFVENFTGQWLQLRNLAAVAPDASLYPLFDANLARAMQTETEEFFAHVLRNNASVLELLDSNYTFLNSRLASHYGIENIEGPEFRLVELAGTNRGGLLTQASILSLTSHHNRTSPVKRGQWILQQILGTPPPPPPPNVAQLDESPQAAKTGSLRERLELHRASPECASCHQQMDPLGFGLENFDAIGRWRDTDGEFAIDASGVLPGNREFTGVGEMKSVLVETGATRFSWCLIENLLTYGLGRSLEPHDFCTVEAIRKRLSGNDFKIQEILLAIVESQAFQNRGVER